MPPPPLLVSRCVCVCAEGLTFCSIKRTGFPDSWVGPGCPHRMQGPGGGWSVPLRALGPAAAGGFAGEPGAAWPGAWPSAPPGSPAAPPGSPACDGPSGRRGAGRCEERGVKGEGLRRGAQSSQGSPLPREGPVGPRDSRISFPQMCWLREMGVLIQHIWGGARDRRRLGQPSFCFPPGHSMLVDCCCPWRFNLNATPHRFIEKVSKIPLEGLKAEGPPGKRGSPSPHLPVGLEEVLHELHLLCLMGPVVLALLLQVNPKTLQTFLQCPDPAKSWRRSR